MVDIGKGWDLPDAKDIGSDTAMLLLHTVIDNKDLPRSLRFEAKTYQLNIAQLTEEELLEKIVKDKRLAEILSLHTFTMEKRSVVDDDIIQGIEEAIKKSLK